MSRHLYNPFMPSVHFRDHAVFGGGSSGGAAQPIKPAPPVNKMFFIMG